MDRSQLVTLISRSAATIREDLALMETGTIKYTVYGSDVTFDQAGRMKATLDRLETILEAYERPEV